MANWSNPLLTSTYTNFVTEVKDRDVDLALQFDGTTSTNIPTNTIRWNSSINRWQKWNGSAWAELTSTYALTALSTTGLITLGGPGIAFPAAQVASSDPNILDDYEEGTFTPTVIGVTTAGTGTYTTQAGKYTKIGGLVYVEVALVWTAHTGTGAMQFAGLPFTAASTGKSPGIAFGRISNIALTAGNLLLGYVGASTTTIPLRQYATGGSAESTVPIDTAGEVNFSATYMVV